MADEVELQSTGDVGGGENNAGDVSSSLAGKYLELEVDGKIVNFEIKSIGDTQKNTSSGTLQINEKERAKTMEQQIEDEKAEEIFSLVPDSTNAWLYIDDSFEELDKNKNGKIECGERCGDALTNKFIAVFVLILQIAAYITMATFLGSSRNKEMESRAENCYGPNCKLEQAACMELSTGGLTSILLVGFLWADVVNTVSIATRSCRWALASLLIIAELITAIVCGFLVGIYSESNFDAIGGAVGILFVHDLDEKVFASMQVFRGQSYATLKKTVAIVLWIVLSVVVAVVLACEYNDGSFIGTCKVGEYECQTNSECIWEGFVCNGVKDCKDETDEGNAAGCDYAAANYCPDDKFLCIEDGSCIDSSKRCDGNLDCPEGWDEGRSQNCSAVIRAKKCSNNTFNQTERYPGTNDSYHIEWTGRFKCNNGQCIDARFACDGQTGDCVDGSDEYPDFFKGQEYPFLRTCPYARLIECEDDEVLCKINGQCISKVTVCDGNNDCPDGEDEKLCDYTCKSAVTGLSKFQCGGAFAFLNKTTYVLREGLTDAKIEDGDVDYVTYEKKSELSSPTDFFENSTGACIPVEWRCDGTNDCSDGSDEAFCGLIGCSDDEYQCTDTGTCLPKSWLCDGIRDCNNGEDEEKQICVANGVSASSNECLENGYYYQCQGSSICLYEYQMCDGYQNCPSRDDEVQSNCEAAALVAANTGSGGSSGSAECGNTLTDYGYNGNSYTFSFTMPSDKTTLKVTTCLSDHQGDSWIYMGSESGDFLYSNSDTKCKCSSRSTILGVANGDDSNTYTVTPGTTYTIEYYQYYTGTYAISIECGTSDFSQGEPSSNNGDCEGTNINNYADNPYSSGNDGYSYYGNYYGGFGVPTFDYSSGGTPSPTLPGQGGTPSPTLPGQGTPSPTLPGQGTPSPTLPGQGTPSPTLPGQGTPSPTLPGQGTPSPTLPGQGTPSPTLPGQGTPSPTFPGQGTPSPTFPGQGTPSPTFPGQGTPSPTFPGQTPSPSFRRRLAE